MVLDTLALTDFRNYENASVAFAPGVNVICGENAAGKTNLLEAAFYFAAGKSFRGCKDRELIRFGCETARAEIAFSTADSRESFAVGFPKGGRRKLFRNGCEVTKLSDYLGAFRAVVFTPDHLHLVKGAPENRRRFLDMAICQSFPRYVSSLSEYSRLLAQKNALLRGGMANDELLGVYNERMAACGAVITVNRRKYLRRLEEQASPFHGEMSAQRETLSL